MIFINKSMKRANLKYNTYVIVQTPPPPPTSSKTTLNTTIIVYGDMGIVASQNTAPRVAQLAQTAGIDFIYHVGDIRFSFFAFILQFFYFEKLY
jgi:hypothetical protein